MLSGIHPAVCSTLSLTSRLSSLISCYLRAQAASLNSDLMWHGDSKQGRAGTEIKEQGIKITVPGWLSGVGPSTPISVSPEHACHSETSVISLSPLLHLTGAHQSLREMWRDVERWASPLAPHYIVSVLVKPRPVRTQDSELGLSQKRLGGFIT